MAAVKENNRNVVVAVAKENDRNVVVVVLMEKKIIDSGDGSGRKQ